MEEAIVYKVSYQGIDRIIGSEKALREERKKTKALIDSIASDNKLSSEERVKQITKQQKKLGEIEASQVALRTQAKNTKNAALANSKSLVGAYDRESAKLRFLRSQVKDLAVKRELGIEVDEKQFQKLNKEVSKLDELLKDVDASTGQFQRNVGNYPKILQPAAAALGDIGFQIPDISKGALLAGGALAGVAIAGEGLKATAQYVAETTLKFQELRKEVSFLTGATGSELDGFTSRIEAISNTFDADFNEVLKAANTEAKQTGISLSSALDSIETRFLAGADSSGELLDSIKEYAPFINEAKISTEQFSAILVNSANQGIFGDKGIDAIKEAVIRIRELPEATEEAINNLGITSEELQKIIAKDGIGGAIGEISERLGGLADDSPELGKAIAEIFGGAGEDAGAQYIKSLKNINDEQSNLIDTSNKYTRQQQAQLSIENQLAEAQLKLSNSFGESNIALDLLADSLKAELTLLLVDIISLFKDLFDLLDPFTSAFYEITGATDDAGGGIKRLSKFISLLTLSIKAPVSLFRLFIATIKEVGETAFAAGEALASFDLSKLTNQVDGFFKRIGIRSGFIEEEEKRTSSLAQSINKAVRARNELAKQTVISNKITKQSTKDVGKEVKAAENSISNLNSIISELQKKINTSDDPVLIENLSRELDKATKKLDTAKTKVEEIKNSILAEGRSDLVELAPIEPLGLPDEIEAPPVIVPVLLDVAGESLEKASEDLAEFREMERLKQIESIKEDVTSALSLVQTATGFIGDFLEESSNKRLGKIEEDRERELSSFEGTEEEREEINKKFDKKREQEEAKAARQRKKIAQVENAINTALAVTKALPNIVLSGIALATGIANGILISQQEFAQGGTLDDGILQGKPHSQGGVKFMYKGRIMEAEGGETIINKNSSKKYRGLLSAINVAGGGKKFAAGDVIGSASSDSFIPRAAIESSVRRSAPIVVNNNKELIAEFKELKEEAKKTNSLLSQINENTNTSDELTVFETSNGEV